ncbi:MAG: GTPase HflX [Lachnospiraceae bacterium]|jgi:GTP-binding protein HflX|nr:GTP-binding protein HflX [Lachnospiraceae bacterium A4]MCI8265696.1 GTPase HflX [Lachnospiraceae bacterium]
MDKVLIVGVNFTTEHKSQHFDLAMEEMASLVKACDMEPVGRIEQNMESANTATYIGAGKVQEVREMVRALEADLVVFDNGLSPIQLRNLSRDLDCPVMDRTTLILEIFSARAKTREAKLQVEVARLQYMLPRLVGLHDALSRQGGASGAMSNKGAGEKKLELDRRRLEQRLTTMRRELEKISGERETQRKKRAASGIPRVALVGYTNAGKSTVMNAMLSAYDGEGEKMVYEEDMLFATLDTTVRRITPPDQNDFLLSDTVGFISNLPHNLVKAFRSTLEEVREADLLIQVIDYSDENYTEHIRVTEETLKDLGAERIPMIYAYNKADLCGMGAFATIQGDDRLYLSAKSQSGIDALMTLISGKLSKRYQDCAFIIPYQRGDVVSYLNDNAVIHCTEYREDGVYMETNVSRIDAARYEQFLVNCYERLPGCE